MDSSIVPSTENPIDMDPELALRVVTLIDAVKSLAVYPGGLKTLENLAARKVVKPSAEAVHRKTSINADRNFNPCDDCVKARVRCIEISTMPSGCERCHLRSIHCSRGKNGPGNTPVASLMSQEMVLRDDENVESSISAYAALREQSSLNGPSTSKMEMSSPGAPIDFALDSSWMTPLSSGFGKVSPNDGYEHMSFPSFDFGAVLHDHEYYRILSELQVAGGIPFNMAGGVGNLNS